MDIMNKLQSFAVDKSGRIRSVDEVARGLQCDCICTCCGEKLIARQGDVREWHFAHASGAECEGAGESALHLAAKQVLLEAGGMTLPKITVSVTETLPDGRKGIGEATRPEIWIDFQTADAEKSFGKVRPDVTIETGNEMLFVEIAVTHFVDEEKQQALKKMGSPTIEINLAGIEREKWDWAFLREVVIESALYKQWLHPLGQEVLKREAREAAFDVAVASPLPETPTFKATKPPRLRFWVGSRMVDVIELPFGLAVWSPFDPNLNLVIKKLMWAFGGRWQPKFKNWLVPVEAKPFLLEELKKLSGRNPDVMS
jgi:competence protein CoiA